MKTEKEIEIALEETTQFFNKITGGISVANTKIQSDNQPLVYETWMTVLRWVLKNE